MTPQILWVDTTTNEEARALDRAIWDFSTREEPDGTIITQAPGSAPENGKFWSHALDRINDDPDQRYAMARRHLPLPAAWREMAIALRTKIQTARSIFEKFQKDTPSIRVDRSFTLSSRAFCDDFGIKNVAQELRKAKIAKIAKTKSAFILAPSIPYSLIEHAHTAQPLRDH
ncbi:hypothetical protein [Rhizobium leguminosarum]|uniref:hypothetical protein n=1 Tax=Rhizobium leguminosarum TaxID=384 RepID=UPI0019D442BD|nr:hypothetical protein [Rhizobium leguminosarum]